ncbi:MAG: hypothetical protein OEZ22_03610 [Spirochaetia bacterium]|nr:hypothetical protein [Spirochaetia bacterium]
MRGYKHCPYCGKEKKFDCRCEYGQVMKIKMDPNEKQKGLFHKKYCPKCGKNCTVTTCSSCNISFSNEDFWISRLW